MSVYVCVRVRVTTDVCVRVRDYRCDTLLLQLFVVCLMLLLPRLLLCEFVTIDTLRSTPVFLCQQTPYQPHQNIKHPTTPTTPPVPPYMAYLHIWHSSKHPTTPTTHTHTLSLSLSLPHQPHHQCLCARCMCVCWQFSPHIC